MSKIRITGIETTSRRVDLAVEPRDLFDALKRHVLAKQGIRFDAYEKNGKIMVEEEYHTSHSWFEEKVLIDNPTNAQLKAIQTLKAIAELL